MSKTLTTEQQTGLLEFLQSVPDIPNLELQSQLNYWKIELKPKRVRKAKQPLTTNENVV